MRSLVTLLGVGFLAGVVGCKPGSSSPPPGPGDQDGAADAAPGPDCAGGTQPVASENRCEPVLPTGTCGPNTFAQPGSTECVPVGWITPCPAGFVVPPDGWGCTEIVADAPCPAGQRADVKTGACVAVGDCNAPFPPAAATLFVDASYTPAELDATHFQTITAAVAAAPGNATIAIESGQYTESVGVIGISLTLVGRCAAQVVIEGGTETTSGIFSNQSLTLSGVTVTGFPGGVLVQGGVLTLEDSIIDSNSIAGLIVQGGMATVQRSRLSGVTLGGDQAGGGVAVQSGAADLQDCDVADNVFGNLYATGAGSTITAARVVASRNTTLSQTPVAGSVMADQGGRITLSQCVVGHAGKFGVSATNGGNVTVSESVVRATQGTLADSGGVGAFATGGEIDLTSSLIAEQPVVGVYAGAKGTLKLSGSIVRGPAVHSVTVFGRGAEATGGALTVTNAAFLDVPQAGIGAQSGGHATVAGTLVRGAYPVDETAASGQVILFGGFGLEVDTNSSADVSQSAFEGCVGQVIAVSYSSTVTATDVVIRDTLELAASGLGAAVEAFHGATFTLNGGLFLDNIGEGLITSGSTVSLDTVTIRGTKPSHDGTFGHGLVALAGATVTLTDTGLDDNALVGLVADDSQIRVVGGAVTGNSVAVQAQNGSFVTQSDDASALQPGEVRVSMETIFAGNASNLGTGEIPVPTISASP